MITVTSTLNPAAAWTPGSGCLLSTRCKNMKPTVVKIPIEEIRDWDSFHSVFARVFGFPEFYGRNMNAWIDCMTSIDDPEEGMSVIHGTREAGLCLDLGDCTDFARRCPDQYGAILDSTGFVNYRRIEAGGEPVLSLSFWNREPLAQRKQAQHGEGGKASPATS